LKAEFVRNRWLTTAVVLLALVALGLQMSVVARAGFFAGDFRAFYCAARVASHGADPYRAQPLHDCETAAGAMNFFSQHPRVTIPAPLPGYAIALLEPLSLLPFQSAAGVWLIVLVAAWITAVVALARVAAVPWEIALAALSLALGVISVPFGEVVPAAVAFICLAAYFARAQRWRAAAFAAAGAMIEPHVGLPTALALAVWAPRTRIPLFVALAALGAVSLLAIGPRANLEYFVRVLPAHALSEATRDTQYSLTAVLTAVGVPALVSVKAGAMWYAAMLALGTAVAGRFAKRTRDAAFIAAVPPAFAVFGGTFIHVTQVAAALPAAVLLASYARREYAVLAVTALLVLSVPWGWAISPALIVAPVLPTAYLAWYYWSERLAAVTIAGIAAALLLMGLQHLYAVESPRFSARSAAPAIDAQLPEASWSEYSRSGSRATAASWAVRLPTWAALLALLMLLAAQSQAMHEERKPLRLLPREVP
jgi:hypothetical protein